MKLSKLYWKVLFSVFVVAVAVQIFVSLVVLVFVPQSFDVSEAVGVSVKFASLPMKYLLVALIGGGLSRDFFLGFFIYYSWVRWHEGV